MKETQQQSTVSRGQHVTAVLGPTNTGKTHLAVERMLAHKSGMIGLPLRLLAREIYDRVVDAKGSNAVALITGEEKIVPKSPHYYICTVEAMPRNVQVEFIAIDEIQLAGDEERGHIFSDRLLNWRGTCETLLLGAETIRPLLQQILPSANFITRPRFSQLSYGGQKKISRLARRSAIVAFSSEAVYTIAEFIRRQRGGAAVVMGALSPRTRNAQVGLYQSGEVDFLVATDAIGMGLNMDVGHVAFAASRKFDGSRNRDLTPAELAQIAGRAGRHMNDGTFGVTGDAAPLSADVVQQIENHRFDPLKRLQWRSTALDYSSLASLSRCLAQAPASPGFTKARAAGDVLALESLARDEMIAATATSPEAINKLWQVCQIPDYRNTTSNDHAALLASVYRFLMSDNAVIPADWLQQQLDYADRTDGDIDTLATRIAHIRTWTFVANRTDWLDDAASWRECTRAIEERLSDALHNQLTQRFIDRRTSVLMRRLREKDALMTEINTAGEIRVEGEFVGRLDGFRFIPDSHTGGAQGKALRAASLKATAEKISERVGLFAKAADEHILIDNTGAISWQGQIIARLQCGTTILKPDIEIIAEPQLSGTEREAVHSRVTNFIETQIEKHLEPLVNLASANDIEGLGRGIAFRLCEELGVLSREDVAADIKLLDQTIRKQLRKYGVRFGAYHIFCPTLLKPAAANWRILLWALNEAKQNRQSLDEIPQPPQQGLTSVVADPTVPAEFYRAAGFAVCGTRAVRIDMLERVADMIRVLIFWKPENPEDARPTGSIEGGGFAVTAEMMSLVGCSGDDFAAILRTLGYRMEQRASASDTTQSGDEDSAACGDEKDVEKQPATLEVWLPRRIGKAPDRTKSASRGKDNRAKAKDQNRQPSQKRHINKRTRPEKKAPDLKDSPFAALVELKKTLENAQAKNNTAS